MTSAKEYIQSVFATVKARNGHEAEFLQAVEEFFSTLEPVFEKHPEYIEENILARITEPERVISFRVPWVDRDGKVQVNRRAGLVAVAGGVDLGHHHAGSAGCFLHCKNFPRGKYQDC